jgi:hypothetical protein
MGIDRGLLWNTFRIIGSLPQSTRDLWVDPWQRRRWLGFWPQRAVAMRCQVVGQSFGTSSSMVHLATGIVQLRTRLPKSAASSPHGVQRPGGSTKKCDQPIYLSSPRVDPDAGLDSDQHVSESPLDFASERCRVWYCATQPGAV